MYIYEIQPLISLTRDTGMSVWGETYRRLELIRNDPELLGQPNSFAHFIVERTILAVLNLCPAARQVCPQ